MSVIGSGATNPHAFTAAIESARKVFDMGLGLGFAMDLLDLGGGFSGGNFDMSGNVDLGGVPLAVNRCDFWILSYFPIFLNSF